ncbi:MAG: preprotein translocase subunit SecG [Candidatus Omnitrophica bacterium]|nr:preprotein translocase subunit SecG [Candidatus Omnitrophota bacterium]MDD5553527.1 preprotein translocase subunit SecG [Candidatus Omnitrophota bacterium]
MMGFIITLHVVVCALLIALILIQRGRGGGLAESFSDVESMLGTKTSAFLTRTTTILSVLFFFTCLTLAVMSVRQSRSLMREKKTPLPRAEDKTESSAPSPGAETPKVE